MTHEENLEFEKTLDESKMLLEGASRVADEAYEFTLESILAEFGEGGGRKDAAPPEDAASPKPALSWTPGDAEAVVEAAIAPPKPDAEPDFVPEAPDTPQSVSLQDVLARTVREALDEKEELIEEPPRRGLFSRKKARDTEELYDAAAEPAPKREPEAEDEYEAPEEPEPPVSEAVAGYREAAASAHRAARASFAVTLLMWIPPALAHLGLMPELYAQERLLNTLPYLVADLLLCVLGRSVILYALEQLRALKATYELLTALLCLAAIADTALCLLLPERAARVALPLHSIAALAMTAALWGRFLLYRSMLDTLRVAAVGDAPYMVTITAGGAAKRRGGAEGFINAAQREDVASRWQTIVLPVVLAAALTFSVLSTVQIGDWTLYAWNLSAILAGADALAFPLVYALPLRRLVKRFTKSGGALAGYAGADAIRRSNCVILTDTDLFPPGTVTLNGLKIFGEESGKVISYAATMAHATESGLTRLFDNLLASEGANLQPLSGLNFYEEGGVGGMIHGESVLFGTASFCRKMGVPLPRGLTLKTGMFLAVDGALIAVFAVKYMPAENVDWALHALLRARITPVLAARDGNLTPALLKRKFGTDAHAVYPALSTRLALSTRSGARPCALLYREGLMPYAEIVVGSKRLCRAVRVGNVLSLLASVAGTMLAFYLTFAAAYNALTPLAMLAFVALWALVALIDGFFIDRY